MFKTQNFCHIASNNRNQVKVGVFVYRTTDSLATVLTSGYFNDRIIDINLHDLIIHEKVDSADATKVERNLLCVTGRTLENVSTSIIKSKWEEDTQETIETLSEDVETIKEDIVDIKAKDIEQDGRLDDLEQNVAYKATDFETPITSTNKGITQTEETTLNNKIDLAANSGRMITAQGVWYAKMYAATVAPAADDDTNYADFSQTDGQGNPIIVTYTRTNGAWVQSETITPPAEYDGYVPITSKIWDIPEQAGQQGGRILWNHQSKEFTPYPQIISFENINVTGESTVDIPVNPVSGQIVNKQYVDNALVNHGTGRNVGDTFLTMRNDNELNGAVECDGATYNTTDFTGAQSIGQLLADGKVPYVSMATYATEISTKGWCDKFGWDGAGNVQFKVPTLNAYIWQKLQLGIKGSIGSGGGGTYFVATGSGFTQQTYPDAGGYGVSVSNNQTIPGASVDITSEDVSQQRCMVQLATSASDEALETCTSVLADVAELKYDYVVNFQAPTAQNNYTWYRKYKSGWVEQGGCQSASNTAINLPIAMANTHYTATITANNTTGISQNMAIQIAEKTATTLKAVSFASGGYTVNWQVSGMAAS